MYKHIFVLLVLCCTLNNSYAQRAGFLLLDIGANQPFEKNYTVGFSSELSVGIATVKKYNQFVLSAGLNSFRYKYANYVNSYTAGTFEFSYRSYPDGKGWYIYPAVGVYKEFDYPADINLAFGLGGGYQIAVGKKSSLDIFTKLNALRGGFYWVNLGVGFQFGNQLK